MWHRVTPKAGWIVNLKGKSGVYLIRVGAEIQYVGHSHTGRLRKTMLRHFQVWADRTGRYHYQTSSRTAEVRIIETPPRAAARAEVRLIQKFNPPGNRRKHEDESDVPF